MKELLEAHEQTWLGATASLLDPRRRSWSRGFLEACAMYRRVPGYIPSARAQVWDSAMPGEVQRALGHPIWRTLRTLEIYGSPLSLDAQLVLLRQPELANLRALYAYQTCLGPLSTGDNALRISELAVAPGGPPLEDLIDVLRAPCFERVRRLHVFGCGPELGCEFSRPDLTLIAVTSPSTLGLWIAQLTARNVAFDEVRLVSSVFPLMARQSVELVLKPVERRWSALEIRWGDENEPRLRDSVIEALGQLGDNVISQVAFVGPTTARFDVPRWKQRIRGALVTRQPGIEIT